MVEHGKSPRSTAAERRRSRGSGGIVQLGDGLWKVDIEGKRDPVTGARRRISRQIRGTREDAELALAKLRVADHERRLPARGTNAQSVDAVFQLYLDTIDAGTIELSPTTVVTTRSACRIMGDVELADGRRFGDVRLSRLSWQDIEDLYAVMRASGKSPAYVRRCATALTRALEIARKRGLIDNNPAKDAARPRTSRSKPFAPRAEDVRAVLDRAQGNDPEVADAATILASTGMRRGELLGLQWQDVDVDGFEIHVGHAIADGGKGVGVVRKPTKRSDWRDVPLTAAAVDAFERQRARQRALLGEEPASTFFVFGAMFDPLSPMRPDDLTQRWAGARGDSKITLLHLRHYCATRMLDAGESYRTVADILGNSESTLRLHYDGRTDVGKRKAIAALEL